MNCKYCNAEVGEGHKFCPFCGETLAEDMEIPVEETMEEAVSLEDSAMPEEDIAAEEKPKKKVWKIVLAVAGAVVALGVLAVVLLTAFGVDLSLPKNDITRKQSYTVTAEKAADKADVVIATVGDTVLTNQQLQVLYGIAVNDFISNNYYYLSYLNFDYSLPLDEQNCYYDDTMTWQQYFIEEALNTWQTYQGLCLMAQDNGYTLEADWQAELDAMPETLETQATDNGYESADALVKELFGSNASMDAYLNYSRVMYTGSAYYISRYNEMAPSDQEIEDYFTQNEGSLAASGVTKESGLISDVRHILICPEGGTMDDDGNTTYSDDEWAACYAKAEDVLNQWKTGEATEDSFIALAQEYSEDSSAEDGGLYEGIAPGSSYVEDFLSWSIDMSRQTGDVDIVKSEYGYHIMYFVSGEPEWIDTARSQLLTERTTALFEEAAEKYPIEVTYRKIVLTDLEII